MVSPWPPAAWPPWPCAGVSCCLAAVRHQHGGSADGGVKPLAQAFLAANVQVAQPALVQLFGKGANRPTGAAIRVPGKHAHRHVLLGTVGVQELAGKIARWQRRSSSSRIALFLGNGQPPRWLPGFPHWQAAMNFSASSSGNGNGHALLAFARWPARCRPGPRTSWAPAFRSMFRPSASSPMATRNAACAKVVAALDHAGSGVARRRNRRCSLRSMGALPFCTSAPQVSRLLQLCGPWRSRWRRRMPSRPVRPPSRMITSPGTGLLRGGHGLPGHAPTTAPISIRLAT